MTEQTDIVDANEQILQAIKEAERIQPAGAQSLVAIAARAVDAGARLSQRGISDTLGLHPSVVIAITVTGDLAGDTNSRRDYGLALFERLKLGAHAPRLTPRGRLLLATWCLERLSPMAEVLGGDLLTRTLELARPTVEGRPPGRGDVLALQQRAEQLQRAEVVGIRKGETKEKLGISDEQRCQVHAGQAIRALLQGLLEQGAEPQVTTTVAGEVAGALGCGLGFAAAAGFTLELAHYLEDELPREHLVRAPTN